jgi:hypothetical protein
MGAERQELDPRIKKQGVIAVILQPMGDDTHGFYLVDHNHYSQDEEGHGHKQVRSGLGLMSETFKKGETPDDIMAVLTRGVVEEMCGYDPDLMDPEVFEEHMRRWQPGLKAALRKIGSFEHDFNYKRPDVYLTEPDTRGHVQVFVDDRSMMYVGPINQDEAAATMVMGQSVLTDQDLVFRSGYDTRLILGSAELQDILVANAITIAE